MKQPVNAPVTPNASTKTSKNERRDALITRLIAGAELDFGCCGHAKPKEATAAGN